MQTHRDIEFGDGVYTFKLGMAQIIAIEEKCKASIGAVYARTLAGVREKDGLVFGYGAEAEFRLQEVIEICRQGLIGGGTGFVDGRDVKVSPHLANHLVATYLNPDAGNPLHDVWVLAARLCQDLLYGYEPAIAAAQKKSPKRPRRKPTTGSSEARSSATA
jgi:hypothetical protein